MGRYYKTDKPQLLDYMYNLPEEYLFGAVQQASQDLTENQAALFDMYGKLELPALSKDKGKAREILDTYEQHINQLSTELQEDPLAFRKRTGDIMRLSRDLHKEFTRGEAAAIRSNYSSQAEWDKRIDDMIKAGKIENPLYIDKLRSHNLSGYEGVQFNPSTGNYNTFSPENPVPYVNVNDEMKDAVKELEPYIEATAHTAVTGEYLLEWGGKREYVTADRILEIAQNEILSDEKVKAYIQQGSRIGALSGFYEMDNEGNLGNMISPYITKTFTDKEGKEKKRVEPNPRSALAPMFDSLITAYAYDNQVQAYRRLKNKKGSNGTKDVNEENFAVDRTNGRITKTPYDDIDTSGDSNEAPSVQVTSMIKDLRDTTKHNEMILDAGEDLIETLPTVLKDLNISDETADEIVENITSSLAKGVNGVDDVKTQIDALKENYGVSVLDIRNIDNAVNQIESNKRKAHNLEVRHAVYQDLAAQSGLSVDEIYTHPDYQVATMDINDTFGAYYYNDGTKFNDELQRVNELYKTSADLPDNVIVVVEENGQYTANEMTKDALRRQDYLFQKRKSDDETESTSSSSTSTPNARNRRAAKTGQISKVTGGKDKKESVINARQEIELGKMSRVLESIPYIAIDENGNKKPASLQQPFRIQVENVEGKNVSILIPSSDIDSETINQIDNQYRHRVDLDSRVRKIDTEVAPALDFAKDKNLDINYQREPFELIDGVSYIPPTKPNSEGKLIFNNGEQAVVISRTNSGKFKIKNEQTGKWEEADESLVYEMYKNVLYNITE